MSRTATLLADHADAIEEAVERFGDHEDMNQGHVARWLAQFDQEDVPLALKVIQSVQYVNGTNIRTMTRQLLDLATHELHAQQLSHAAFVPVGAPGSGSAVVARVLRDALRGTNHGILDMLAVSKAEPGAFDAVVFVDDFSGTGNSLTDWWENVESVVRPTNAAVFVALLVITEQAMNKIGSFAGVVAVRELDVSHNAVAGESRMFTRNEKPRLRSYCDRTRVGRKLRLGYGQCGLLLAFAHGCPNNSLPILWAKNSHWRPLFKRSAI